MSEVVSGLSRTSAPELTQVMIHVEVGPAHPVCVGHIAKDGVRRSEAAFPRRDQLDEHLELRHVGGEVRRLGPANFLIDLRSRGHASRPLEWRIKRDPLDDGGLQQARRGADVTLSGDGEK